MQPLSQLLPHHLPILTAFLLLFLLPQLTSAQCLITRRGLSHDLLLTGTILTNDGAQRNSVIFIQAGKLTHVGDACGLGTRGLTASVIACGPRSVISPGFINTHEHIDYATVRPFAGIGLNSDSWSLHRHDWRLGARNALLHRPVAINGSASDAAAWGELRHVFSATTAIVGGAMSPGLARNLDFSSGLEEGLRGPPAVYETFPLRDKHGTLRLGDCDYGPEAVTADNVRLYKRYIAHVGEGVDAHAANEFACLSNLTFDTDPAPLGGGLSTDVILPNVALVHALALTERDFELVAARGTKIVWSPRSNVALYGATLNASALLAAGVDVALGTDWLPSGSATMAREAACAKAVLKSRFGVEVKAKTLWDMATRTAALVAGFEDQLGALEVGMCADVAVFAAAPARDNDEKERSRMEPKEKEDGDGNVGADDNYDDDHLFAQAIFAPQERVELVLRGGKILLASTELGDLTSDSCEQVVFGKTAKKIVCVADELGFPFAELRARLQGMYPAILPDIPPDEPPCE
ncbi:metal dependent amidohydrolase [Nemania sp. FL0916]|nr:metal dependent amidohydrolase [Nemania sp. FL0916]